MANRVTAEQDFAVLSASDLCTQISAHSTAEIADDGDKTVRMGGQRLKGDWSPPCALLYRLV